jgi:predicted CXXCH cytochrome family protein
MMISKKVAVVVGIIGMIGLITVYGCVKAQSKVPAPAEEVGKPAAPAEEVVRAEAARIYEVEIKPLTVAECGQCHFSIFETIKETGAKHRIECVRCHREYHVYNPRKQNYDEIMPKCASCHLGPDGGPFHGEHRNLTPCLACHADPHKPLIIPMEQVETSCALCHTKENKEIQNYPSKHTTDVACADCHAERHGYIPDCSACHEPHSPDVELATADCMACHPVHRPTQIEYSSEDTPSPICAGCHDRAYDLLQKKETGHTAVKCSECHPAHKEIPPCSRCHGAPHSASMVMDMTNCGACHGIAHDLAM